MMVDNRHILYILSQFPETHETFITREIVELKRQGWRITILSIKPCRDRIVYPPSEALRRETVYPGDPRQLLHPAVLVKAILRAPGHLLRFSMTVLPRLAGQPGALAKTAAGILNVLRVLPGGGISRPDHIHAHWATVPASVAMFFSGLLDVPFSFTAHAWDIFLADRLLYRKLRQARFVVTCTGFNRQHLIDTYPVPGLAGKVFLNYHGVETGRIVPEERSDHDPKVFRIVSVGRLVEQKGFAYLIAACGLLRERNVTVCCDIIGTGPLERELTGLIRRGDMTDTVHLTGILPFEEVIGRMRRADAFVLPCVVSANGDRDGIPNVLIEAMALGGRVVSTTVSGVPELIDHGVNGYLVPPRNAEALAVCLAQLRTETDWSVIAARARDKVERDFSIVKNVRELADIFNRQVAARG